MAENKKAFVLYCDLIDSIKHMGNEEKAIVFTWILEYVNDLNPKIPSGLLGAVIEPIRNQLKRDLKKYESRAERSRLNGSKGGRPKNPKKPSGLKVEPKKPDTVTVTDTVTDINNIYKEKDFLKDWTDCRKAYLNKPTGIKKLNIHESTDFKKLVKDYQQEEFKEAMRGLFNQKNIAYGAMLLRPKHLLENFEKYYTAQLSKDYELYGKEDNKTQKKIAL